MRIVITHTDFRLYWPARIAALQEALVSRGDELYTIEIAGKGSPYAFSDNSEANASKEETATIKGEINASNGECNAGNEQTSTHHAEITARNGSTSSNKISNWICLFPTTRMEDIPPAVASKALLAKLNELCPDVVLCGSIAFPSGAAAVYWAKDNHKAVVMFDDVKPEAVPRGSLVNYIKQLIYEQVDAVLCPAAPWTKALARWNFRPEQVFFGVDVVDNDFWAASASLGSPEKPSPECLDVPASPDTLPSPLPTPYFLAVGRQIAVKNLLFLLQVYATYREKISGQPALPLLLVGNGPQRGLIESYIRERRLEQVYLLPFANKQKLRTFYQQAAALVLPSRRETWGLVVNEAMAAGLPVLVSSNCGCAPVLVQTGVNGYAFSPDRPEQLLEAMLSFTNLSAAEKAAMGKASRCIIRPWGLDQFVNGSLQAIDYARINTKTCRSMPARFILKNWRGRYRPV